MKKNSKNAKVEGWWEERNTKGQRKSKEGRKIWPGRKREQKEGVGGRESRKEESKSLQGAWVSLLLGQHSYP